MLFGRLWVSARMCWFQVNFNSFHDYNIDMNVRKGKLRFDSLDDSYCSKGYIPNVGIAYRLSGEINEVRLNSIAKRAYSE